MSEWGQVFGASWFWIAAALVWARAGSSVYGVSRRLIKAAKRDPEFAQLAHQTVCWSLGPGRLWPARLDALRQPVYGALAAILVIEGVFGNALALALFTVLAPILVVGMALEPRMLGAASAVEAGLGGFLETLDQAAKAKLAAVLVAVLATLAASALTAPGG